MTGLLDKLRGKSSTSKTQESNTGDKSDQAFSILPHPATTNNPADEQGPQSDNNGLQNAGNPGLHAFNADPGPVISEEVGKQPVSTSQELNARAAQLNEGGA